MAHRASKKRKAVALPPTGVAPPSATTDVRRLYEAILIIGSLVLLLFLVYTISTDEPLVSPFILLGAILFLLYPLRGQPLVRNLMWLALTLFLIWSFNELSGLLLPFIIAFLIAYLLDPVVGGLRKKGIARWVSTLGVMLLIVGVGVSLLLFVLPLAFTQFDEMLRWVTNMVKDVAAIVREGKWVAFLEAYGLPVGSLQQTLNEQFSPRLENITRALIEGVFGIIASISTIVTRIINVIIIPFLAFYLLKDFPVIGERLLSYIPASRRKSVRNSLRKVDALLGRYIRGALTVAVIHGILASVLLWIFGIDYPLVLGMVAGILSLIPYFGLMISLVLSILVALFSGEPSPLKVVFVLITFGVLQILEGAVLSPRILGKQVGLHPVLLILSLVVFSFFLGFIGLLIAVPTTAVVLMFVREYKAGVEARQVASSEIAEAS